jgi:hypothetical protein
LSNGHIKARAYLDDVLMLTRTSQGTPPDYSELDLCGFAAGFHKLREEGVTTMAPQQYINPVEFDNYVQLIQ